MSDIRVRFSPAPTGLLHIGNARSALFNWLYARHTGGTFILRIEDTDVTRSTQEAVDQIQHVLGWLGLEWDEGPILQSHRFETYLAAAERLVESGHAYECFCTEEEVKQRNDEALAAGRKPGYDGRCRDLTAEAREQQRVAGRPRSIRFRTPDDGTSTFDDVVRGDVSVEWSTVSDFVIVRSNGTPVFFLANAVDDIDMDITHVLRGEDLIDSTHRVLALRRALGAEDQPAYAHLPMVLGPGGGKLSKRHGAISVEEYRDQGILADALVNYLALLGWAPADDREVLTREELVEAFDLGRVNHAAATFDPKKLEWINGEHIRRLEVQDLAGEALPFAKARYAARLDIRTFDEAVKLAQERSTTLVQIAEQAEFLFVPDDAFDVDPEAVEAVKKLDHVDDLMAAAIEHIEQCEWNHDGIALQPVLRALGLKSKHMKVLYAAITGRTAGLPLFESIEMLGRARALTRLRRARAAVRVRMRLAFKIAWRTALAVVTLIVVYLAVTFVQVWRTARKDAAEPAHAIVVLGAAEYDGRPSPVLAARLDHALELYDAGVAPVIVVTGGRQDGDRFTEATAGATYLHEHGVPDTAILRETNGRSSWESLAAAARFLQERDQTKVVLVSDPYHAARIDDIAEEVGLDAVTSPTRTSPISGGAEWRRFGTETLRVAAGRLFGYRRLEQGREMGEVVPGLGMLIAPSGVV